MIYSAQVYKEFQFGRMTFEDSDLCGQSVTVDTEQNVPKVEVSAQRRPKNYRKSFIGKLESDASPSPGCMEAFRPLGAPSAYRGTEEG